MLVKSHHFQASAAWGGAFDVLSPFPLALGIEVEDTNAYVQLSKIRNKTSRRKADMSTP